MWRVRALDGPALDAALAHRHGVGADPHGRLVPVADERDAAALLASLVAAGVRVTAFGPLSGDFERTFLALSGTDAA